MYNKKKLLEIFLQLHYYYFFKRRSLICYAVNQMCVWLKSTGSSSIKLSSIQRKLYVQEKAQREAEIQMQILEVTQHSDSVQRDLFKNAEVRVIE